MKRGDYFKPQTQDPSVRLMTHGRVEPMERNEPTSGVHALAGASATILILVVLWALV